jgi:hypothetical protein
MKEGKGHGLRLCRERTPTTKRELTPVAGPAPPHVFRGIARSLAVAAVNKKTSEEDMSLGEKARVHSVGVCVNRNTE